MVARRRAAAAAAAVALLLAAALGVHGKVICECQGDVPGERRRARATQRRCCAAVLRTSALVLPSQPPRCRRPPRAIAASAADFLEVNAEDMQCMNAVLQRAGLVDAMGDDLPNTYFFPTDAAFLLDLGVRPKRAGQRPWQGSGCCWAAAAKEDWLCSIAGLRLSGAGARSPLPTRPAPTLVPQQTAPALSLTAGSEARSLTVQQIKDLIGIMPVQDAVKFTKAHVVPQSYPTVRAAGSSMPGAAASRPWRLAGQGTPAVLAAAAAAALTRTPPPPLRCRSRRWRSPTGGQRASRTRTRRRRRSRTRWAR